MALGLTPQQIIDKDSHPLLRINKNWERVLLVNISDVQNGAAFSSKFFNHDSGLPLIRIRDINSKKTENYYSGDYNKDFVVSHNDILIGMDGDFRISKWPGKKGLLNQRVCRLHFSSENYNKQFFFICLQPYLNAIHEETSAVTVKHLSSRTIQAIPLPLPPLPEQRAIVAKIEQLFSELDKGIDSFKSAQQKLDIYRQAVLKKAFEGELTKTWREQQNDLPTADELLQQIKQQRQQHYQQQIADWEEAVKNWEMGGKDGRKPAKPRKIKEKLLLKDVIDNLEAIQDDWKWINLTQIIQSMCLGKMLDKKKNKGEFLPYLGNINVRWGKFNSENLKKMRFQEFETKRYNLNINDLVICEGGEPGRCAIWESDGEIMIQKALHRVRFFQDSTLSSYIFYYIQFLANTGQLEKYFTGTTIKHLTGKGLEKIALPFCSFQEQTQIVQAIESRLSVCDKLSETLKQQLKKAEALRQSILKKAFEGRLLTQAEIQTCQQQADWEPAEQLLARIKAESAKKPVAKPRKKQP